MSGGEPLTTDYEFLSEGQLESLQVIGNTDETLTTASTEEKCTTVDFVEFCRG
jgi:hypothetical protein